MTAISPGSTKDIDAGAESGSHSMQAVGLEAALAHGLTGDEFDRLVDSLGRQPNMVELGVVSAMWSEHCSYKSSRRYLRTLPCDGAHVIQGPGENAGAVDIGDGLAAVFKMESHNHPSQIEPFQGAATGVGGILRDVFTMGARPIALINALRFGDPAAPRTRDLVAGVVAGISHYGNCVGVPTIGGETQFDSGYDGNVLVNVMAVGVARADRLHYARGARPGLPIIYVGSGTGRDGIHGAAMASAEFSDGGESQRPTVQVGDPFAEKRLLEACLELMQGDCIVAVQDMGAAGLTSSSVEIADKGGVGVALDLDLVPQREDGMSAYEIMLSESQERMLMVLRDGAADEAARIFAKWDLASSTIGRTDDSRRLRLTRGGREVCDLPVPPLVDRAPNYDRLRSRPAKAGTMPGPAPQMAAVAALARLMSSPDMCCKRWMWEQFDRGVMGDTLRSSATAADAALVRVHGTGKALALTSDCTPRYVAADPRMGGMQAVAECRRNLICAGSRPLAITDNLNFGNPERPEIMAQFAEAVAGMAEACRALELPVVSGNVSLYNETDGTAIPPTPVIGGVGLIEDIAGLPPLRDIRDGDTLVKIGAGTGHLGCSLYARELGTAGGLPPPVCLTTEKRNGDWMAQQIAAGRLRAAHDVGDGGLACAAAEMALAAGMGVTLSPAPEGWDPTAWYFGEDQAVFLAAIVAEAVDELIDDAPVPVVPIGRFGGREVGIGGDSLPLDRLRAVHEAALPEYMEGKSNRWPSTPTV